MCAGEGCQDRITRRTALSTGVAAAFTLGSGEAQQPVAAPPTRVLDDPAIEHGLINLIHGGDQSISGYLARPKAEGRHPAVLVIAGNRISEEYIPNTCAALAVAGFVGLAPNIFHYLPETAQNKGRHTELDFLDDIQAGASYLRAQEFVGTGGMGILGFCVGGRLALLFAARSREIDAVVAFHPGPAKPSEIARLTVPVQLHHGTDDHSEDVDTSRRLEQTLRSQKTPVELFLYEGADHGFLAYTRPFYRADQATLAWRRSVEFLHRRLS